MSFSENFELSYVSLSGIIGAGKSTLATKLSKKLEMGLYLEKVADNDILELFYKDMGKYSFTLQISLLTQRYKQQHLITWSDNGCVQDRSFYEDLAFARVLNKMGKMSDIDLKIYEELFFTMIKTMNHPTVIVHLDVSPEIALDRIQKRGRKSEKGITLEYLKMLNHEYKEILKIMNKQTKVVIVDWTKFSKTETIARKIFSFLSNNKIQKI